MTRIMLIAAAPMLLGLTACDAAVDSFNAVGEGVEADMAKQTVDQRRASYTPAQAAYAAANDKMHGAMGDVPADPDVAFMAGMIPHHQGAIDMARVVLDHGDDPEAKALAQSVIAAQEAEIAQMRAWLEKNGAAAPTSAVSDDAVDHSAMGH